MAGILSRLPGRRRQSSEGTLRTSRDATDPQEVKGEELSDEPIKLLRFRIIIFGMIVSLGGFIFGYDTGQISGFVAMPDFLARFADNRTDPPTFGNVREGTIVGLLSIGTLIGVLVAGPIANALGRKKGIVLWCLVFIVGVIIQITTSYSWVQIAIGRLVAGFGVGGLSVMTPMYQSETAPRQIRGALVSTYQLFITLGILVAYLINFGTYNMNNANSWRITMGVGFIFPVAMAVAIMFLPESPRWDYSRGNIDAARRTISKAYGVPENHREVAREMREIRIKFEAESAGGGKHPWYEVVTGPRMTYRVLLGITLQIFQQLTGANYFFYYGTTVFQSVGLANPYVTSIILGAVNFGCTFGGLYVVEHFGRRVSLMIGGCAMFVCFMIFASVGHFGLTLGHGSAQTNGYVMIIFTCIFLLFYATTWAPIIWALVAEIYPSRYRATAMGLATAGNWTFNFLISFFTPFITAAIDYRYGYIFAACNLMGAIIVYFFVCESSGRSLEEIDTMYVMHVNPRHSKSWVPPEGEEMGETDRAQLGMTQSQGGGYVKEGDGGMNRGQVGVMSGHQRRENISANV